MAAERAVASFLISALQLFLLLLLLLQGDIVDAFLKPVSREGLESISARLLAQFMIGLAKENHNGEVKMLITYVHNLPNGKEKGDFLALDLG